MNIRTISDPDSMTIHSKMDVTVQYDQWKSKVVSKYHAQYEANTITETLNSCISSAKLQPANKSSLGTYI